MGSSLTIMGNGTQRSDGPQSVELGNNMSGTTRR